MQVLLRSYEGGNYLSTSPTTTTTDSHITITTTRGIHHIYTTTLDGGKQHIHTTNIPLALSL